jgi:hypothetical protein
MGVARQEGQDLGPLDAATAGGYSDMRCRFSAFLRAASGVRVRLTLGFSWCCRLLGSDVSPELSHRFVKRRSALPKDSAGSMMTVVTEHPPLQ